MRHLLSACVLIMSVGCAVVPFPDVEPHFENYALHSVGALGVRSLPPAPEVRLEGGKVVLDNEAFRALEVFVEAAYGQQRQLEHASQEIEALQREANALILAGRMTEYRAQLTQHMYVREAQSCQWPRFALYGLSASMLVLLGVAL